MIYHQDFRAEHSQTEGMKMIHSCLRVLDLATSAAFYEKAFGLKEHARYRFDDFTLLYMRAKGSDFELELTQNHERSQAYDLGNAYGHLALVTEDLETSREAVERAGGHPTAIKSLDFEGKLLGRFFFATDPDGYKIEVLARAGRFD